MSEQKKQTRSDELDKFWDIDALIPRKTAPRYASDTEATEIVLEPKRVEASVSQSRPQAIPP